MLYGVGTACARRGNPECDRPERGVRIERGRKLGIEVGRIDSGKDLSVIAIDLILQVREIGLFGSINDRRLRGGNHPLLPTREEGSNDFRGEILGDFSTKASREIVDIGIQGFRRKRR